MAKQPTSDDQPQEDPAEKAEVNDELGTSLELDADSVEHFRGRIKAEQTAIDDLETKKKEIDRQIRLRNKRRDAYANALAALYAPLDENHRLRPTSKPVLNGVLHPDKPAEHADDDADRSNVSLELVS